MTETTDSTTTADSTPAAVLARDIPTEDLAVELLERAQADGVNLVGPGGLLADLTKRVLEAGLNAELNRGADARSSARTTRRRGDRWVRLSNEEWRTAW